MKNRKSIALVIALLTFSLGTVSAQTIVKKANIIGSYRVVTYIQPDGDNGEAGISYDAVAEKAKVDKALATLKRTNPAFTANDSVEVVTNASLLYVSFSVLVCTYKADGTMTLAIGAEKPEEAQWTYDEATGHLTVTDSKGRKDEMEVEKNDGKIYLVQITPDGTITEFVKQ